MSKFSARGKLWITVAAAFLIFCLPSVTHAFVVVNQLDTSVSIQPSNGQQFDYTAISSGTPVQGEVYISDFGDGNSYFYIIVADTRTGQDVCDMAGAPLTDKITSNGYFSFNCATSNAVLAGDTLHAYMYTMTSSGFTRTPLFFFGSDGTYPMLWIAGTGEVPPAGDTRTRILSLSPTQGSTTPNTFVISTSVYINSADLDFINGISKLAKAINDKEALSIIRDKRGERVYREKQNKRTELLNIILKAGRYDV